MVYHVYSKSISNYVIFREEKDYERMQAALRFFLQKRPITFSKYNLYKESNYNLTSINKVLHNSPDIHSDRDNENLVDIVAYCVMPTHIHLLLLQRKDKGVSLYMNRLLNSYTKYFNTRHRRRGPLWESRFKKVLIQDDGLVRDMILYFHLEPVHKLLVDSPEKWLYSSFCEYIGEKINNRICNHNYLHIEPKQCRKYLNDTKNFQKVIPRIQPFLFE